MGTKLILFAVLMLLIACSDDKYNTIIQNKKEVLKKIENTSLIHRNSFITFTTHNDTSSNIYSLKTENDSLFFLNEKIGYMPNLFSSISKQDYELSICKTVKEYEHYIESLNIKDYTSSFSNCCGIDYKFYLNDGSVLLYVKDISLVKGAYLNFLKQCEKVEENWFYSSKDW